MRRQLPSYKGFDVRSADPWGIGMKILNDQFDPVADLNQRIQNEYQMQQQALQAEALKREEAARASIASRAQEGMSLEDALKAAEEEYLNIGAVGEAAGIRKQRDQLETSPMEALGQLADVYGAGEKVGLYDAEQAKSLVNEVLRERGMPEVENSRVFQGERRYVDELGRVIVERRDGSRSVVGMPKGPKPKEPKEIDVFADQINANAFANMAPETQALLLEQMPEAQRERYRALLLSRPEAGGGKGEAQPQIQERSRLNRLSVEQIQRGAMQKIGRPYTEAELQRILGTGRQQ